MKETFKLKCVLWVCDKRKHQIYLLQGETPTKCDVCVGAEKLEKEQEQKERAKEKLKLYKKSIGFKDSSCCYSCMSLKERARGKLLCGYNPDYEFLIGGEEVCNNYKERGAE